MKKKTSLMIIAVLGTIVISVSVCMATKCVSNNGLFNVDRVESITQTESGPISSTILKEGEIQNFQNCINAPFGGCWPLQGGVCTIENTGCSGGMVLEIIWGILVEVLVKACLKV